MTLTEFLLARIAEETPRPSVLLDSELAPGEARGAEVYPYDSYRHAGDCGLLGGWDDGSGCTCDGLARTLAECEAKRRIVETHRHADYSFGNSRAECPSMPRPLAESMILRHFAACDTLLLLATVYADHPDYREEWKP